MPTFFDDACRVSSKNTFSATSIINDALLPLLVDRFHTKAHENAYSGMHAMFHRFYINAATDRINSIETLKDGA
jgi:hypothetical protein